MVVSFHYVYRAKTKVNAIFFSTLTECKGNRFYLPVGVIVFKNGGGTGHEGKL